MDSPLFVPPALQRTEVGNYVHPDDPGESGYATRQHRRSVTDEEAAILADLAAGRRVLEIGTGLGVSTRALASTAEHVTTVDPDPWVQDPGLPNVTFLRAIPTDGEFDLAFIDGNHVTESVLQDIAGCLALNIQTLVLHDTYLPCVQRAITQSPIALVREYPTACRLAIWTPNAEAV